MPPTTIKKVDNSLSDKSVTVVNWENYKNNIIILPTKIESLNIWISQHKDKPLTVQTKQGVLAIWDQDWKILGFWYENPDEIELLMEVKAGKVDYTLTITYEGKVKISYA